MWVPDPLYQNALCLPGQKALQVKGRQWTWADLEAAVNTTIAEASCWGMGDSDRVAILAANSPEYIFWILALTRLRAVIIFLNTRLTPLELEAQLALSGANFLVYDPSHPPIGNVTPIPIAGSRSGSQTVAPVLSLAAVHSIFFTSGTTGKPKAAALTLHNHYSNTIGVVQHLSLGWSERSWLLCLPLFHVGGCAIVWRSVWSGKPLWLQEKFESSAVIRAVASQTVGLVSLVPTMLWRLLQHPDFMPALSAWQQLEGIIVGGSAFPRKLREHCQTLNLPILPTYGLTEAASQVTTLLPHEVLAKPESSGRPLPGMQVRVVDPTDRTPLPPGGVGEIEMRGAAIFQGYLDHPPSAPWFATGDLGKLDREGYLFVLDRRTDLIVSGGENIYPSEVESVLLHHPQIHEVSVVGVEDEQWGTIGVAVIEGHAPLSLAEIHQFCQLKQLARYKFPQRVVYLQELPRNGTGKILRSALKAFLNGSGTKID